MFQQIRSLTLTPAAAAVALALAVLIGLLSAAIPASSASRTSVVESIRRVV